MICCRKQLIGRIAKKQTDREFRVPDHDRQLHEADKNSINKGVGREREREQQNNKERGRATALRALFDLLKSE